LNIKKTAEILGIVVVCGLMLWLLLSGRRTAMFILFLAFLGLEIWLKKKS